MISYFYSDSIEKYYHIKPYFIMQDGNWLKFNTDKDRVNGDEVYVCSIDEDSLIEEKKENGIYYYPKYEYKQILVDRINLALDLRDEDEFKKVSQEYNNYFK